MPFCCSATSTSWLSAFASAGFFAGSIEYEASLSFTPPYASFTPCSTTGIAAPKPAPISVCFSFDSCSGVNMAAEAAAPCPAPTRTRPGSAAAPPTAATGAVARTLPARRIQSMPASGPRPLS
jgi:hypothetical protein